jgi:hypothetical protein
MTRRRQKPVKPGHPETLFRGKMDSGLQGGRVVRDTAPPSCAAPGVLNTVHTPCEPKAQLDPLYGFFSHQAHAQGLDIYNLQGGRDNAPRYLPKSYDIWFSKMLSAFERTPEFENLISDTRRYL